MEVRNAALQSTDLRRLLTENYYFVNTLNVNYVNIKCKYKSNDLMIHSYL